MTKTQTIFLNKQTSAKRIIFFSLIGVILAKGIIWAFKDIYSEAKFLGEAMNEFTFAEISSADMADEQQVVSFVKQHAVSREKPIIISHLKKENNCWLCTQLDTPFIEENGKKYSHDVIFVDDVYRHVVRIIDNP